MRAPEEIVLEKLWHLAALTDAGRPPLPSVGTPADLLAAACALARAVAAGGGSRGRPLPATVADFFAFLRNLPPPLAAALSADAPFPPGPRWAWEEPTAPAIWRLAALIQDVWAHTLGPEAAEDPGVLELVLGAAPRRVYDFGCGAGHLAFELARLGIEVTCIDRDPLRRAFVRFRRRQRPEGVRVRLRAAEPIHDLVLAMDVLDHLRQPTRAVRALAARLRPGGVLVLRAAFPDDGWHRGGERVADAVGGELLRLFRHPATALDPGGQTALLVRRREPAESGPGAWRRGPHRLRLHPAAMLSPTREAPGRTVLAAPRFYTRPLLLDPLAARMARMCRRSRTADEIRAAVVASGGDAAVVGPALDLMIAARLLLVESPAEGESPPD